MGLGSNVGPAHAARRGQIDSDAVKAQRAQTRYQKVLHVGPHEQAFASLLHQAPVAFLQQFPIGPYNLDFLLPAYNLAVEIVTGGGNRRIASNKEVRRLVVLADHHLIEVRLPTNGVRRLSPFLVGYVMQFGEAARSRARAGIFAAIYPDGRVIHDRSRPNCTRAASPIVAER